MLTLTRITDSAHPLFQSLKALYTEAFPREERREIPQLEKMLTTAASMYFNAVECDGVLAGLFVYWNFEDFYYLEHLAVFREMRNHKIGQQVLDWVAEQLPGIRLLEVEPAVEEIAIRRIHYYERNGYVILDKDYLQPPYDGKRAPFPLWIMGNRVGTPALNDYVETIKQKAYRQWVVDDN